MNPAPDIDEPTLESELATTYRYIDLYIQQKTDLFLQHYVFEPFDFLFKRLILLAIIITLMVSGTIILVIGIISLMSTVIPLWAALLITGAVFCGAGGCIAYSVLNNKIILKTPTAETINNGKP